jgi:hypothetical protein
VNNAIAAESPPITAAAYSMSLAHSLERCQHYILPRRKSSSKLKLIDSQLDITGIIGKQLVKLPSAQIKTLSRGNALYQAL